MVTLDFTPGGLHRAGLGMGAAALVALVLLAAVRPRRAARGGRLGPAPAGPGTAAAGENLVLPLVVAVLLAGPAGVLAWLAGRTASARRGARAVLAGSVLLAVLVALGVANATPWRFRALVQVLTLALVVAAVSAPAQNGAGARSAAAEPPAAPTRPSPPRSSPPA